MLTYLYYYSITYIIIVISSVFTNINILLFLWVKFYLIIFVPFCRDSLIISNISNCATQHKLWSILNYFLTHGINNPLPQELMNIIKKYDTYNKTISRWISSTNVWNTFLNEKQNISRKSHLLSLKIVLIPMTLVHYRKIFPNKNNIFGQLQS